MHIKTNLIQKGEEQDNYLYRRLFPVSIRLLKSSLSYRAVIAEVIEQMTKVLNTKYEDYNKLQGLSGANVGIPFNIVLLAKKDGKVKVLLNPSILYTSTGYKTVESNCGSLNLKKPIEVSRHKWVMVGYNKWDNHCFEEVSEKFHGGTIQHEMDHNNGILITDEHKEV